MADTLVGGKRSWNGRAMGGANQLGEKGRQADGAVGCGFAQSDKSSASTHRIGAPGRSDGAMLGRAGPITAPVGRKRIPAPSRARHV